MEYRDTNDIKLKDTYFYNPHASYVNLLRKHGIDSVCKLLDNEGIVNMTIGNSREQLKILISLYKYEYMGQPLGKDRILNRRVTNICNEPCGFNIHVEGERRRIYTYDVEEYLENLLVTPKGSLYKITERLKEDKALTVVIKNKTFKVVDLLRWILVYKDLYNNKSGRAIKNIIMAYIESLDNHIKDIVINHDTIDILKGQITELIKARDNIDIKILELTREIDQIKSTR